MSDHTQKMKKLSRTIAALLIALLLLLTGLTFPAAQSTSAHSKISPHLQAQMKRGQTVEFFVILSEQADLSATRQLKRKADKGTYVYQTLWESAQSSQKALTEWLDDQGIRYQSFYIVNALLVEGDSGLIYTLAERADVARLEANPTIHSVPAPIDYPGASARAIQGIEPNISYVKAPEVWDLGFTGKGIVIGAQDTGYDWDHPALINQYRGWNGATADHNYNWHDSIHSNGGSCGANSPQPCDDYGHGTHTAGTAVGGEGSNQIGMAPGAKWIGCRNMDAGAGTPATYLECLEFFLAPYPIGATPAQGQPGLAPDVTTNSWTCPPSEGCSWNTLQSALEAQRAAGIMTVAAAGNSGSSCSSIKDPISIYDAVYTVGALNTGSDSLASFSGRGPVTVDGSARRKPDLVAPGTGVRSSRRGGGYTTMSGTSMATPNVAGAVALLWSAVPTLTNNISATENYLNEAAVPILSSACSSPATHPNNLYGYGRLDIFAAVQTALADYQIWPAAEFTHTTPVSQNQTVIFTNLSTGAQPLTSTWNFGDGTAIVDTGTILLPIQHTYTITGNYTAGLTVTNPYGQSTFTQTITVLSTTETIPPGAAFTYTTPVYQNQIVTFANISTGTAPMTATWNFGDGSPNFNAGTVQLPVQYTYAATGTHTVALSVTNVAGQAVVSQMLTVLPDPTQVPPMALYTYTKPALVNQTVIFTNLTTGVQPISSTWNFGDGSPGIGTGSALLPVQHTYTASGVYTVSLFAENQFGGTTFGAAIIVVEIKAIYLPLVLK